MFRGAAAGASCGILVPASLGCSHTAVLGTTAQGQKSARGFHELPSVLNGPLQGAQFPPSSLLLPEPRSLTDSRHFVPQYQVGVLSEGLLEECF